MLGTITWFSPIKGFGFIAPEDHTADVFVHFSDLEMEGYKTIEQNQKVSYELGTIEKNGALKPKAINVRILQ